MTSVGELFCGECTAYLRAVEEDGLLHRALAELDSTLCADCLTKLRERIDDALLGLADQVE
jgi:hypothetical protein